MHDIIIKKSIEILEDENCKEEDFNQVIGSLFFAMHGLVQKEELILFPAASEVIDDKEWIEMQEQSFEYGFPFIEKPEQPTGMGKRNIGRFADNMDGELVRGDKTDGMISGFYEMSGLTRDFSRD